MVTISTKSAVCTVDFLSVLFGINGTILSSIVILALSKKLMNKIINNVLERYLPINVVQDNGGGVPSGRRGRMFESCHSDQKQFTENPHGLWLCGFFLYKLSTCAISSRCLPLPYRELSSACTVSGTVAPHEIPHPAFSRCPDLVDLEQAFARAAGRKARAAAGEGSRAHRRLRSLWRPHSGERKRR